jgi:hypothetical protein
MRGSVVKRKNCKTYALKIDLGVDPVTGKRTQRMISGEWQTKKEAQQALIRTLSELQSGSYVETSRQTVADYLLNDWLPSRKPAGHRAGKGHRGKLGLQTWPRTDRT